MLLSAAVGVSALVYHGYPQDAPTAEANPPFSDHTYTTDVEDGHGDSHYSRVRYDRWFSPWRATVRYVRYGGRHPDGGFCWDQEYWKLLRNDYFEWQDSEWSRVERETSGWRATGTPDLDYHRLNDDVRLTGGAMVENVVKYKWNNWCLTEGTSFVGIVHRHFLE